MAKAQTVGYKTTNGKTTPVKAKPVVKLTPEQVLDNKIEDLREYLKNKRDEFENSLDVLTDERDFLGERIDKINDLINGIDDTLYTLSCV